MLTDVPRVITKTPVRHVAVEVDVVDRLNLALLFAALLLYPRHLPVARQVQLVRAVDGALVTSVGDNDLIALWVYLTGDEDDQNEDDRHRIPRHGVGDQAAAVATTEAAAAMRCRRVRTTRTAPADSAKMSPHTERYRWRHPTRSVYFQSIESWRVLTSIGFLRNDLLDDVVSGDDDVMSAARIIRARNVLSRRGMLPALNRVLQADDRSLVGDDVSSSSNISRRR